MQLSSPISPISEVLRCEVCGNSSLIPFLNLGNQPLPDDLVPVGDNRVCERYPIDVRYCTICRTANQRFRVAPGLLFHPEYHYRASQTMDVLDGMQQFAEAVGDRRNVEGLKVLDIGCNDGSLLDFFRHLGAKTYGIEPTDAGTIAASRGHPVDRSFFGVRTAQLFYKTYGCPDIITFTNVFAHIDNLSEALGGLKVLIDGDEHKPGRKPLIVIENHYLGSVLEKHQFDTFYHEHPRTYSATSFIHMARRIGYRVAEVQYPVRYGGNIRVFLEPGPGDTEAAFESAFRPWVERFERDVMQWQNQTAKMMHEMAPLRLAAFPARASILINMLGLDVDCVEAIYEKEGSPKSGHYAPGTRIPILGELAFNVNDHRPLWNLAWHIPAEMEARWRQNGFKGDIINVVEKDLFHEHLPCTWA